MVASAGWAVALPFSDGGYRGYKLCQILSIEVDMDSQNLMPPEKETKQSVLVINSNGIW